MMPRKEKIKENDVIACNDDDFIDLSFFKTPSFKVTPNNDTIKDHLKYNSDPLDAPEKLHRNSIIFPIISPKQEKQKEKNYNNNIYSNYIYTNKILENGFNCYPNFAFNNYLDFHTNNNNNNNNTNNNNNNICINSFFTEPEETKPSNDKLNYLEKSNVEHKIATIPIADKEWNASSVEIINNSATNSSYKCLDDNDEITQSLTSTLTSPNFSNSNSNSHTNSNSIDYYTDFGATEPSSARTSLVSMDLKILDRNNSDAGNNPVTCFWRDCNMIFGHAKLLYRHICEDHIGRKHPQTHEYHCLWGTCKHPMTYKRDHLISHIMVHVPMKNFSCEICKKKFKRSHDLKKHSKIHLKDCIKDEEKNFKPLKKTYMKKKKTSSLSKESSVYCSAVNDINQMAPREVTDKIAMEYHQLQYNYYQMLQQQQQQYHTYLSGEKHSNT